MLLYECIEIKKTGAGGGSSKDIMMRSQKEEEEEREGKIEELAPAAPDASLNMKYGVWYGAATSTDTSIPDGNQM